MGAKHQQLQNEMLNYLGVENIELMVNGHMSLELSLQAMDLDGEVITTPFTLRQLPCYCQEWFGTSFL